jgi:methionine-rich copper-binding protein CopC
MKRRTRLLVVALLVLPPVGHLIAAGGGDDGTIRLLASSPADGQTLAAATEVRLDLSTAADPVLSHITVADTSGRTIPTGPVTVGPPEVLRVPMTLDTSGTFTAAYHIVDRAGATTSGTIRFAVGGPQAQPFPPAAPRCPPTAGPAPHTTTA